jgi:predicted transcriptional regulator
MAEKKGHFEKGLFVEDKELPATQTGAPVIDQRLSDATKSVISSVDVMMKVTHDLITTEEGKQYLEKTLKETQTQIQKSFDEIISKLKDELDKKVKNTK